MIEELKERFETIEDAELLEYNTYKLDTKCRLLMFPKNIIELKSIIDIVNNKNKWFIIGNGSNIILPDYYDGIIIKLKYFSEYSIFDNVLTTDAGVMINKLSMDISSKGYKGLEWASGIPGTIGGCIYNNAGCYGSEICDNLISVTVLDKDKIYDINRKDLEFSYRDSIFKSKLKNVIILSAKFKIEKSSKEELLDLIKTRTLKRVETQPLEYPSCGSVFRNPEGVSAGKLIDESNLKGYKINDAMISYKHANFIINTGKAKSKDIIELINIIKATIKKNYNIDLVLEQEIIK